MTMMIGALVCSFLPDSPVKAKRFSDVEKVAALMRVKNNQRYSTCSFLKMAADTNQWNTKCTSEERANF
jgi:hypothetical protein